MALDTFGGLLRRHRLRARLTQEALAELAGLSARSVRDIERGGSRAPRPSTVERLADALRLTGEEREAFRNSGEVLFWVGRTDHAGYDDRAAPDDRPDRTDRPTGEPGYRGDGPDGRWPVRQLPADTADFVGREVELTALATALDPAGGSRLAVISGPPGIGKTALAVRVAHRLAGRFPDGQLFLRVGDRSGGRSAAAEPDAAESDAAEPDAAEPDAAESDAAAETLARVLRALGVSGQALPVTSDERAELLRARLAGRRVLLVLDDVAGHGTVQPMLPPEGVALVATSRLPLTGLPGVTAVDLAPLAAEAGIALLARVAGDQRVQAESSAARELVAVCGGLPLAVRIVAARLAARPHWTVAGLTERLADAQVRLDEFRHGDLAVRPQLQLAHRGLTPPAATLFALLGELRVPSFPGWTAGALLATGADQGTALLEELLDARLVDAIGLDQAGQPRFRLHEITRLFARECRERLIPGTEWTDALSRVATGWLALARHAQGQLRCERLRLDDVTHAAVVDDRRAVRVASARPMGWFEAEREALTALVVSCAEAGLAAMARCLTGCTAEFYAARAYYEDWRQASRAALAACRRVGDRAGAAAMSRSLGGCLIEVGTPEEAMATLRTARTLALEVADPVGAALARKDLGLVLSVRGRLDEAEVEVRAAAEELAAVGEPTRVIALTNLAFLRQQRGDVAEALRISRSALAIARAGDSQVIEAFAWRRLSSAALAAGRIGVARLAARRAVELFEWAGDAIGAAQALRALGEALARDSRQQIAAEWAFAAAATMFRDRGHSWGLALTELSLGEVEAARGETAALDRLRRCLRYWTEQGVPALRARTLVALATAAERSGNPGAAVFRAEASRLYQEMKATPMTPPVAVEPADEEPAATAPVVTKSRGR